MTDEENLSHYHQSYSMTILKLLITDLNLLSCEFDGFTFKLLYCVIFILIRIKLFQQNSIYKTFTDPFENSKIVSYASSRMKYNLVFPALSKFTVKLTF